jgi:NitT/TauT family transport system substrate-binding protein
MLSRTLRVLAAASILLFAGLSGASAQQLKKYIAQGGAPVPYIAFIPIYVAQQAGFFKQEGLDVEMRYASGAAQATQIAAAGQADSANVTIEPTIIGYDKGIRGKIIMRTNKRLIYYIAVPPDSPIKTVADLKGKKIGVANFGSSAVPVVRSMLRSAGIEPTSDTLLPVGVMDQAMAALNSDKVQALGLYDGIYYGLERAGHHFRYLYHPTLAEFGNGGVFVSDATIAAKHKEVCGYARGYAKGVLFALTNPEAALRMWWKVSPTARRGATDEEAIKNGMSELAQILEGYDIGFPPQAKYGVVDKAKLTEYMDVLKQDGQIAKIPPIDAITTTSFTECINAFDGDQVRKLAREWK